nr:hypothetical protein [Tanacetum cinerariifolium]
MQKIIKEHVKEQVKAFVEAYESDKIILNTYEDTVTLKRRRDDDADKDEEPSAGSDRGSKRRREGKEPESASAPKKKATRSADDQPIVEPSQHPEWFSQQKKPPTLDRDWNKTLSATYISIQPWISELAKQSDSCSSFNELMDTHVDFSKFLMNQLEVDTLTPKLLAGPTYELMIGSCKSLVELEFFLEEVYKATTDQLDWVNLKTTVADHGHIKWIENLVPRTMWIQEPVGYDKHALWGISHWGRKRQQFYGFAINREFARDGYSKRRIIAVTGLKIVEWHNYKHLDWITRKEAYIAYLNPRGFIYHNKDKQNRLIRIDELHKFSDGTLTDVRTALYIAYLNPRGFIYQNKDKQNRLIRIDELHKFSDGTLTDVRTALDDRLKGIRMKSLPQSIWRKSYKDRAAAMIQAIDKMLKTRGIMRSLERFVGGRLYEGDFRMLQRSI